MNASLKARRHLGQPRSAFFSTAVPAATGRRPAGGGTRSYRARRSDAGAAALSSVLAQPTKVTDLSWLSEVAESRQPLSELCPIGVRHGTISEGPPVPYPERHPYCEFGTTLRGGVISFVAQEQAPRLPGDLFLAGPGVPHWATITQYPLEFITVYFLPSVLIEFGPESDGPKILSRFTANQPLAERLVRPPAPLRERVLTVFRQMIVEFDQDRFGREIRLRTLLLEALVEVLRWEEECGRSFAETNWAFAWTPLNKALQYLRENYSEPIYARNLARAAGVSESRLKVLFQSALGMSWVKYLQGYRIHRAAALLCQAGSSITEAALTAGFESISHFNAIFRSCMGVSPTVYQKASRALENTSFERES
jgi:AraC-like DNA-binding protein